MGQLQQAFPVKLLVGVLLSEMSPCGPVEERLSQSFGCIDYRSDTLDFSYTTYYQSEMGSNLRRVFYSFQQLIDPGALASIKLQTNRIETEFSSNRDGPKRPVNLDPGYMETGKLILASTKNHCHRIYLSEGIYAELTLLYRKGHFLPLEWTYPDYRTEIYHHIFHEIRNLYRSQLAEARLPASPSS